MITLASGITDPTERSMPPLMMIMVMPSAPMATITVCASTTRRFAAPRAYEILARLRNRGIPVVLGGVHPTLMPDEAVQHADSTVVGYAEESWPKLLRDFVAGRMAREQEVTSPPAITESGPGSGEPGPEKRPH